jgi:outer membrane beta-barrel protein
VIGGIGSTEFAGDDRFTINFGTGYQILFADAFSLNIDVRDLIFNIDVFGEDKVTHNLQYTVALGWFF